MSNKNQVIRDQKRSKTFTYSKGEGPHKASLSFTLRIDMNTELINFAECLEAALEDVREELKITNK